MKRYLGMVAALMAFLAVTAFPVAAASNAAMVEVSETVLYRGDEIMVTVIINTTDSVDVASVFVEYDSAVLELVEGAYNESLGADFGSFNANHALLAAVFATPKTVNGVLGTVTLRVKDTAVYANTIITVRPVLKKGGAAVAAEGENVMLQIECNHSWTNWNCESEGVHGRSCSACGRSEIEKHDWGSGEVTKEPAHGETGIYTFTCAVCNATKTEDIPKLEVIRYGDVSGDGVINSLDGLILMRYLNAWELPDISVEAMDVNGDEKINTLDGLLLMRYLNGWDIILGKKG